MRSKKQVHADLTQSTQQLLSTLSSVSKEDFNIRLNNDEWSVGQVAEHLIKVEVGTTRFFTGGAKPADRDPEEKIPPLKKKFLDFDEKLTATGPIVPDDKPKDKQKAIDKLQDNRQRLISMIEIEDLTEVLTDFDHPVVGSLTRIEWLYFHIFHSQRHCHQMENIKTRIS